MFSVIVQRRIIGREAHELAAPFGFYTAVLVGGKVRHMHLPYAAGMGGDVGAGVLLPAVGRGLGKVKHHAARTVRPGCTGVGVNDLVYAAVREVDAVDIIGTVQVAGQRGRPDAVLGTVQLVYAQRLGVRLVVGAGGKQADHDPAGGGRPEFEGRPLRRWNCAEVVAVIIRQCAGLLPVHG